jgi:hypothetical protein
MKQRRQNSVPSPYSIRPFEVLAPRIGVRASSQDLEFRHRMIDLFSDRSNTVSFPSVQDLGRELRDLQRRVSELESRLGGAVSE